LSTSEKRKQQRYSGPFVNEIRSRLDSYFAITVRHVRDAIPKAIGFYLVRAVQDKLQFELLNQLNTGDKISELLGEPPHILEERKSLTSQLTVLQRSSNVLTRDPKLAAIAFEAEAEEYQSSPSVPQAPRPNPGAAKTTPAPVPAPGPSASQQPVSVPSAPARVVAAGMSAGNALLTTASSASRGLFGGAPANKAGLFEDTTTHSGKTTTKNPLFG